MASRGQPGALSAVARLLGGVNEGLDARRQRAIEDEQLRRQKEQDAERQKFNRLHFASGLLDYDQKIEDAGGSAIAEGGNARLLEPGSGGLRERVLNGLSPMLPKDTRSRGLPDPETGAILQYRFDKSQSAPAKAGRAAAEETARKERAEAALLRLKAELAPKSERNIDRLSPEGIKAAVELETRLAKVRPRDPLAQFFEGQRLINERARANDWQRIYEGALTPKRDNLGDLIPGTGLTPAEAAAKADEAMGGRPELAPKIKSGGPPTPGAITRMGTSFTPSNP
jgi:hypothetical protein